MFVEYFPLFAIFVGQICAQLDLTTLRQQALVSTNEKRALYCVPNLVSNSSLNQLAQDYADYLAANNLFEHNSGRPSGVGENLFRLSRSSAITSFNGSRAVESWFSEITKYNYSDPQYSSGTGHFTQLIWKATTQVGTGFALSSDSLKIIVVANYYPAGNVQGGFVANVLQPCDVGGD